MPYKGSYIWTIRQKIGHAKMIVPSVSTVAINQNGEILLVFNKDFNLWVLPGGCVEMDATWRESAARELLEEGGIVSAESDLIPFAMNSGSGCVAKYANGDATQYFCISFITKDWHKSNTPLDAEEVSEAKFFSLSDIENLNLTEESANILSAYQKYLATGEFQNVEMNNDPLIPFTT